MPDRVGAAVWRSILIAAVALLVGASAQLFAIARLCHHHRVWERVRDGRTTVVMDAGYGLARPGDAIYTCTTPHATGPIVWHQDLACYCAPATLDAKDLGLLLDGSCTLDQAHPTPNDTNGACLHAHCDKHIDP